MNETNKSVVVDIVSDSKKFLSGFEDAITRIEKAAKKANILGGLQNDINDLKADISSISKDINNIKPNNNTSSIVQDILQKIEKLENKTKNLKAEMKDVKIQTNTYDSDKAEESIKNLMLQVQALKNSIADLNSISKSFGFQSQSFDNEINSINELINKYENAKSVFENFNDKQKKTNTGAITKEYQNASIELYKYAALLQKVDLYAFDNDLGISDDLGILDSDKQQEVDNIFDHIKISSKKTIESINASIDSIDIKKLLTATSEVKEFKLQNGSITVPLHLDSTTSKLRAEVNSIINNIQETIHPLTVPIKFTSMYKSSLKDELKNLEDNILKLDNGELKSTSLETLKNLKRQLNNKDLKFSIQTNIDNVTTRIRQGIEQIRTELNNSKISIQPTITLSDENYEKSLHQIADISDSIKTNLAPQFKDIAKSMTFILNDTMITEWENKFISSIDNICIKINSLFDNLVKNELYNTIKDLNKSDNIIKGKKTQNNNTTNKTSKVALLNTKDGNISEIVTQYNSVNQNIIKELSNLYNGLKNINQYFDSIIYSHPIASKNTKNDMSFSLDELKILSQENIKKSINTSKNGMINELDFSSLAPTIVKKIIKECEKLINSSSLNLDKSKKNNLRISNSDLSGIISKHTGEKDTSKYLNQYSVDELKLNPQDLVNIQKEINQLTQLLIKMSSVLTDIKNKDIKFNINNIDEIGSKLTTLVSIVENFNNQIQSIDFSKINISPEPFDKINNAITNMSHMMQRAFGVFSDDEISQQFNGIVDGFNKIAKTDGSFDARKKDIQDLMVEYQKYLNMGGKESVSGITDNKKSQEKLLNIYSKYVEKQNKSTKETIQATKEEAKTFESIIKPATNAANAKNKFTEANKKVKQSTDASIIGIQNEKNEFVDMPAVVPNNNIKNNNINNNSGLLEDKLTTEVEKSINALDNFKNARKEAYDDTTVYEGEVIEDTIALTNVYRKAKSEYDSGRSSWQDAYENMKQGFEEFYANKGFEYSKSTINVSSDFNFQSASIKSFNKDLQQTVTDYYTIDKQTKLIGRTNIKLVDDGEKRASSIKKEVTLVENARQSLQKYINVFNNKTLGQMQDNSIYKELSNFKITNLDDIEKCKNLMLQLDTAYEKILSDARKGSASLNPFVNMITSISKAENSVKSIGLTYHNLILTSSEVENKIEKLNDAFIVLQNSKDIDEQSNAFGKFKLILNEVISDVDLLKQKESQINSNGIKNIINDFSNMSNGNDKIQLYVEKYQNLKNIITEILNLSQNLNSLDRSQYDETVYKIKSLTKEAKLLQTSLMSDSFSKNNKYGTVVVEDVKNVTQAEAKVRELTQSMNLLGNVDINGKLGTDLTEFTVKVKDVDGIVKKISYTFNSATGTISEGIKKQTTELTGFGKLLDSLKSKWKILFTYLLSFASFYQVWNVFKRGISVILDLDSALTEMQKVSEETYLTLKNFQKESFNIADAVGTTAKQIQNSTADFMRLGESLNEAKKSAVTATTLLNVSEFYSIDEATESLIAMSAAYKDLEKIDIVDVINNIGNNYAISTDGISRALQRSASALTTAQNDLYEATALVTSGNAVVQDPENVGAAMRTIALRLTGSKKSKTELEEIGEDTEGVITTVSKLRDTILSATSVASNGFKGFDILNENGNYKSTYEIMQGISEIYKEIIEMDEKTGSNNKNLLIETIAGKNRSNVAASILNSPEILKSAYEDAKKSEGSAQEELDKYLQSINGHVEQLKNKWQEIWNSASNRETINEFIDFGKTILNIVNDLGLVKSLILSISTILATKKVLKGGGRVKYSAYYNNKIYYPSQYVNIFYYYNKFK